MTIFSSITDSLYVGGCVVYGVVGQCDPTADIHGCRARHETNPIHPLCWGYSLLHYFGPMTEGFWSGRRVHVAAVLSADIVRAPAGSEYPTHSPLEYIVEIDIS